jgi:hypothetical protein
MDCVKLKSCFSAKETIPESRDHLWNGRKNYGDYSLGNRIAEELKKLNTKRTNNSISP